MIKILFVCHGNICRSPMAEFVFRDLVRKQGWNDRFLIASAATSREEIGNPVHAGTRKKLNAQGIPLDARRAMQLTQADCQAFHYLLGMDSCNVTNMRRIAGPKWACKISRLLDFTPSPRDIADPWYTGNFDETFEDVLEGCRALLAGITEVHREEF